MKPLRVGVDVRCIADGSEIRGFARYSTELIAALARRNDIEMTGFSDQPVAALPEGMELVRFDSGREIASEQWVLPRLVRHWGIDVLLAPANRGLPMITHCPTVLTLHDAVEWDANLVTMPQGRDRLRFAYSNIASLWNATLVLTVSQHSARELHEVLAIPNDRIRVVLEAASERFHADESAEVDDDWDTSIAAEFSVTRNTALYVGGYDAKKSIDVLLNGFALAAANTPGCKLVLVGSHPPAKDIAEFASKHGLADRIHCVGYVDDELLPSLYRRAGCFVTAAAAEGFGLPAMEAMASGLPVVAPNAGATPEVVGAGGLLFRAGSAAELGAAIQAMFIGDSEHWRVAARAQAARFSWDTTASQTVAVLREAAATSGWTRARRASAIVRHSGRWVA